MAFFYLIQFIVLDKYVSLCLSTITKHHQELKFVQTCLWNKLETSHSLDYSFAAFRKFTSNISVWKETVWNSSSQLRSIELGQLRCGDRRTYEEFQKRYADLSSNVSHKPVFVVKVVVTVSLERVVVSLIQDFPISRLKAFSFHFCSVIKFLAVSSLRKTFLHYSYIKLENVAFHCCW